MDNQENIDKLFRDKLQGFEPPKNAWESIENSLDLQQKAIRAKIHKRIISAVGGAVLIGGITTAIWFFTAKEEQDIEQKKVILQEKQTSINQATDKFLLKIETQVQENIPKLSVVSYEFQEEKRAEIQVKTLNDNSENTIIQEILSKVDTTKPKEKRFEEIAFLENDQELLDISQEKNNEEAKLTKEAKADEGQKIVVTVKLSSPDTENELSTKTKLLMKGEDKERSRIGRFLRAFNQIRLGKAYNNEDLKLFKTKRKKKNKTN